jgi:ABC-type methionine transport system permease subunit
MFPSAVIGIQIIGGFAHALLGNQGIVRSCNKENVCNQNLQTVDVVPHKEIPFLFLLASMWAVSEFIARATYGTFSFRVQRSRF